ncbi:MAG: hypothetical protein ACJAXA_001671 [Candidatus Aldehydirespiratoraceae bacterium]|jgi:hypothetical protein
MKRPNPADGTTLDLSGVLMSGFCGGDDADTEVSGGGNYHHIELAVRQDCPGQPVLGTEFEAALFVA